MKVLFRGELLEVRPEPPGAARLVLAGDNHPRTVARVLGALQAGSEVAVLSTRLTQPERDVQLAFLSTVPPAGEPATLIFTSGSTGAPKAARLALENHLACARAANEVLQVDASARLVCALPLFHVGGLSMIFRCLLSGATLSLHERFDAAAVLADLRAGATHVSVVAATLSRLLDTAAPAPAAAGSGAGPALPPALAIAGGGPVPATLLARARGAGLRVVQTWGMTETCSMATCEPPADADGLTAGPPLPGVRLRIRDGELEVAGPSVMRGYLGKPPPGEWLPTGDLAGLDGRGRLVVHARRGDLITSGGEKVYPAEVEAALLAHPAVREAAVVPADDERWGQVGVAYVVSAVPPGELRGFLRERLAAYKVPARFVALPELPRTAAGKVDRVRLKELLQRGT